MSKGNKVSKGSPIGNGSPANPSIAINLFFIVAFIEGAAVMGIELAGAKMIAPYYGTSLYVWASVLAVTLGGLTTGYFLGGWASYRFAPQKLLMGELIFGAIFITLMPVIGLNVMPATSDFGVRTGSLISAICFMILPLICMGMVSPTIIQLNNKDIKETGKTAGTIYAVSTIGGILMTFLMGFYLLPEWGIRKSIFLTAILLALMPMMLVVLNRKKKTFATAAIFFIVLLQLSSKNSFETPDIPLRYLYSSEGILGQITVLENPDESSNKTYRHLFINHIAQTYEDVNNIPVSEWGYPHRFATVASIKPAGSNVLLIGLGGSSVAMEYKRMGFNLDIVDLDTRMPEIAEKYFGLDRNGINIFIDDGRHYINTTKNKYDIICIDVLNGEAQPFHMFTLESFAKIKKILKPGGMFIINNQGYIFGEHGLGARSIFKTLKQEGFKVNYFHNGPKEGNDDIHFYAYMDDLDFHAINESRLNTCCKAIPHLYENLISIDSINTNGAFILTDDLPIFEQLNNFESEEWRSNAMNWILKRQTENLIPFFN